MRIRGLFVSCFYSVVFCLVLTSCTSIGERHKRAVRIPETVQERVKVSGEIKDRETLHPEMSMKRDLDGRFGEIPPEPVAGVETIVEAREVVTLPDLAHLDKRIGVYEQKLAERIAISDRIGFLDLDDGQPGEWSECAVRLDGIVSAYSRLRQRILDRGYQQVELGIENEDLWEVFQLDIEYLESGCDAVLDEGPPASLLLENFKAESLEHAETVVHQYAEKGASEEVVRAFNNLKETFPDRKPTSSLKQKYGLALLRTGRVNESAAVLLETLRDLQKSDTQSVFSGGICGPVANFSGVEDVAPLSFKRLVADLLFIGGRIEEARSIYQELQDCRESCREHDLWVSGNLSLIESGKQRQEELVIFRSVLKIYFSFEGRHVPPEMNRLVKKLEYISPESEFARGAGLLLNKVEEQVRVWVVSQLEIVDGLVGWKEYLKARAILDMLLDSEIHGDMRDIVEKTLDDVVFAEAGDRESRRQLMDQALSSRWDEAVSLLDLRKYDEAIQVFSLLVETDYHEKAMVKIKKASDLAAAELRRTAATLFVKARKTDEANRKAELFLESRQLLLKILEQYPRTNIISKVRQNLEALESQILKIDPSILYDESGVESISIKKGVAREIPN